jgi:hypothetical protein
MKGSMVKALVSALVAGIVVGYPSTSPASLDGRDTPGTVSADSTAPVVSIHARHVQRVSPGIGIRLSVAANENCYVRIRSVQLISKLMYVSTGWRTDIEVRPNKRLSQQPSTISVAVSARDAAGNTTTQTLRIRVLR